MLRPLFNSQIGGKFGRHYSGTAERSVNPGAQTLAGPAGHWRIDWASIEWAGTRRVEWTGTRWFETQGTQTQRGPQKGDPRGHRKTESAKTRSEGEVTRQSRGRNRAALIVFQFDLVCSTRRYACGVFIAPLFCSYP